MNRFGRVAAYLSSPYWCVYSAQCTVHSEILEQSGCAFSWINKRSDNIKMRGGTVKIFLRMLQKSLTLILLTWRIW